MGSAKQTKESKGKASPKLKNASSKVPEKSAAVIAKKTKTPAPKSAKATGEKAKVETAKSSHATMKAQIKKEFKAFQKTSAKKGAKKPSENDASSEAIPAAAKTEAKSGKKRNFASIKSDSAVDSSDEEKSDLDLGSEDEMEILNKLDIEPKVNKPEKETVFTGIAYDIKTNDLSVSIQEKLAKRSHKSDDPTGVIFVGRLPSGFEEYELGVFFGQFGEIKKLRLSRNRRTMKSRHYAFIQYSSLEVAKIVAEAVNNYLVYGRLLKCQVVPEEKVHFKMFWGASPSVIPIVQIERKVRTLLKTPEQIQTNLNRNIRKKNKLAHKLKELGINYDISDLSQKPKSDDSKPTTPQNTRQKASPKQPLSKMKQKTA